MKTMKKGILLLTFIASSVSVFAQQSEIRDENGSILRGPYETNHFKDNWFVGVGLGMNLFEGDYDNKASFGNRIAPALDISAGKWITPYSGMRLQYSGMKAKGMTLKEGKFAIKSKKGYYTKDFNVMNLHVDYLWNVTNGLWGFDKERLWNLIPYAGFSLLHASGKRGSTNEFGMSLGFLNTFRLTDKIDLTLEARQILVKDAFDDIVSGKNLDGMTSFTVGVSYKFGKSDFNRAKLSKSNDLYAKRIDRLRSEKKTLEEQNNLLNMQLETFIQQLAGQANNTGVPSAVEKLVSAPLALYFNVDEAALESKDLINLDFFVKYVMNMDETAKFVLRGFPDNESDNKEADLLLTQNRIEYIYNILTEKYGIEPTRLIRKVEKDSGSQDVEFALKHVVVIEPVE